MKKLFLFFLSLTTIFVSFTACEKEDGKLTGVNVVSFTGDLVIGNKTYTNPTFDLGDPNEHIAYTRPQYNKNSVVNIIKMEPWDIIYLPDNLVFNYNFDINTDEVGVAESDGYIEISIDDSEEGIWLYGEFTTTITKIEEIGGYIEGTYTGTFYPSIKKKENPIAVEGVFKVKRISNPAPF